MIEQEIQDVLDWLNQLRANALTVNDGEGEPLAAECEEAIRVIEKLRRDQPPASRPAPGWQPVVPIIAVMYRVSRAADDADGPREYQQRLIALAMAARQFLQEFSAAFPDPPSASPPGVKT